MRSFLSRAWAAALVRGAGVAWALLGAAVVLHATGAFRFREVWGLGVLVVAAAVALGWAIRRDPKPSSLAASLAGIAIALAAVVPLDLATERLAPPWAVGLLLALVGGAAIAAGRRSRA